MSTGRILLVAAAVLVLSMATRLPAQKQNDSPQKQSTAVIDLSRILKEHKRFQQLLEEMKVDVGAAEEALKKERSGIDGLTKQKESLKSGTPEFNRIETELALRQLAFTKLATAQKQEFLQREAKLYRNAYREVHAAVVRHAQRIEINLVMRINEQEANPDDREAILRELNRPIVYHHNLDITDQILAEVNGETE